MNKYLEHFRMSAADAVEYTKYFGIFSKLSKLTISIPYFESCKATSFAPVKSSAIIANFNYPHPFLSKNKLLFLYLNYYLYKFFLRNNLIFFLQLLTQAQLHYIF